MESARQLMKLAYQQMHPPHHIYGIDFSGAQDAGKKIWIAEGIVKTDSLLIEAKRNLSILLQQRFLEQGQGFPVYPVSGL
jgi:hypothetical protein